MKSECMQSVPNDTSEETCYSQCG